MLFRERYRALDSPLATTPPDLKQAMARQLLHRAQEHLRACEVGFDEHLADDRKHWIDRLARAERLIARAWVRMRAVCAETVGDDADRTVTVTMDFEEVLHPVSDATSDYSCAFDGSGCSG
jgi:hypothetical protein